MNEEEGAQPPLKKVKYVEGEEDLQKSIKVFDQVDQLQEQLTLIQERTELAVAQIQAKSRALEAPLYEERRKMLRKIPHFWQNALQGHPTLCEIFSSVDRRILSHLLDVIVVESSDPSNIWFSITFFFEENEFIENLELWKKFTKKGSTWDVTSSGLKIKPAKKRELTSHDTFLNWFLPSDTDTELGMVIRDEVWPNPMLLHAMTDDSQADDNSTSALPAEHDETLDEQIALAAAWASDSD